MFNFFKNEIHGDYAKIPKHQSKNRKEEAQCKWTVKDPFCKITQPQETVKKKKKSKCFRFRGKKLEKHKFNETNISDQTDNKMR